MSSKPRVAFVATHPIQHFCPQYRSLGEHPSAEVRVLFWSLKGLEAYQDAGFGREVSWGSGLLDGVDHRACESDPERVRSELTSFDPDWVVVYGYRTPVARAARAWARRNHKQLAYISDTEERHHESRWKRRLRRARMRLVFPKVDRFLTVGNANEEFYRACGVPPSKLLRMHFPIDPQMFDAPAVTAGGARADGPLAVLTVGKLIPRKRQADLIAAAKTFDATELHVVIAGSGPGMENLHALSEGCENVTLAGFVHPDDLPELYAAADVYAHVSEMDPHPLAVSEAAAGGCALLVSDATGSWGETDDVRPGRTGAVVATGDVNELARALRRFADDRDRTRALGAEAQRLAREQQRRAHHEFLSDLISNGS